MAGRFSLLSGSGDQVQVVPDSIQARLVEDGALGQATTYLQRDGALTGLLGAHGAILGHGAPEQGRHGSAGRRVPHEGLDTRPAGRGCFRHDGAGIISGDAETMAASYLVRTTETPLSTGRSLNATLQTLPSLTQSLKIRRARPSSSATFVKSISTAYPSMSNSATICRALAFPHRPSRSERPSL